jgi:predicted DNA-binding transcriptional regulator AlpA
MSVEIVTKEDLERFRVQLLEDIKALLQPPGNALTEKKWLRTQEVMALLGISLSTLQNRCYMGKLHPKKFGGINYYSVEEIETALTQEPEE